MNLAQLEYFCKVAQLEHYTRAAEELCITQPTLSNSIARLEDELGVPLFERSGRNVRLTKYGNEFYAYAQAALEALDKGTQVVRDQAGQHGGKISLGTIYTIQQDYLPALMKEYRNLFGTDTTIILRQGLTNALIDYLETDEVDMVFSAFVPGKNHLMFMPVLYQRLVLLTHNDDPLAGCETVRLEHLRGRKVATYSINTPLGMEIDTLLHAEGVIPSEFYDDEITLASMIDADEATVGVALDTLGLKPFSDLVRKPFQDVPDDFHGVYLVYKKSSYKTPAMNHFIDLVRDFSWPKK